MLLIHPSYVYLRRYCNVQGKHPQYLHVSIPSTIVVVILVVAAVYVEQRYIACCCCLCLIKDTLYTLLFMLNQDTLHTLLFMLNKDTLHTWVLPSLQLHCARNLCRILPGQLPPSVTVIQENNALKFLYMITERIDTTAILMMPTITIASIHVSVSGLMVVVTDSER